MSSLIAKEATQFFHTYEVECDEVLVQEWLSQPNNKQISTPIMEEHIWAFNDWYRRQGTAYEDGIDDKTKIERLILEVQRLEKENEKLQDEKISLNLDLGIMPF